MVDPQLLRLSEARDLIRLMAQLVRLSAAPSLCRSKLVTGLASILDVYVVGIFFFHESPASHRASDHALPSVGVYWAKPPDVPPSSPFPSVLRDRCERRNIPLGNDVTLQNGASQFCSHERVVSSSRDSNGQNSLIELGFEGAILPPAVKSICYLLYGDHVATSAERISNTVKLLHEELQHHFTQYPVAPACVGIPPSIPERQKQILEKLLRGDGEKQIARQLGLSIHTVHTYVRRLYLRLNVSSRSELFRACYLPDSQSCLAPAEAATKRRKALR